MFYPLIRSMLFKFDPELAQKIIFHKLKFISSIYLKLLFRKSFPMRPVVCMGITFPNALGLAAGFDKNAEFIKVFKIMGFGFIEVGTVTPYEQTGSEKPRIFRLVKSEAIINRMGFNNQGVDRLVKNITEARFNGILGVNIGKNQHTPLEYAKEDYLLCMEKLYDHVTYMAINISSPNTPNLRTLQYGDILEDLLLSIKYKQKQLEKHYSKYVPIVIKISPDLSKEELIKIADSFLRHSIDGVIATNTTIERTLVHGLKHSNEQGGLSGRPIHFRSNEVIRILSKELKGKLPIIGVGGIDSLIAAREKITAGASLIQIYSSLIYKGPRLIKDIVPYL